jgi:hypothetical protein
MRSIIETMGPSAREVISIQKVDSANLFECDGKLKSFLLVSAWRGARTLDFIAGSCSFIRSDNALVSLNVLS